MRKGRSKTATTVRARLRLMVVAATTVLATGATAVTADAATASPSPSVASAIGDEAVQSIAVSSAYDRTGTVVAASSARDCSADCMHLWVTRDRGVSWKRAAARGWQQGRLAIGVTAAGSEVLFSAGTSGLLRSDDGGDDWRSAGPAGTSTVSPSFARDGDVAVAGGTAHDYLVDLQGVRQVQGSGGTLVDTSFVYSPSFPASGGHPPALLGALDAHTGAGFVLRCTAQLACSNPVPAVGPQQVPSGLTLVASPAYAADGTLFANAEQSLYRSTDAGASFVPVRLGEHGAVATATADVSFDPRYGQDAADRTAYVAVLQLFKDPRRPTAGGVYRTTDGGATWNVLGSPSPLDGGATALAVAPDGRIFAGYMQSAGMTAGLLCWYHAAWAASCGGPAAAGGQSHCAPQCASSVAQGAGTARTTPGSGGSNVASTAPANPGGRPGTALVGTAQGTGPGRSTLQFAALAVAAGLGVMAAISFVTRRRRLLPHRGDTGREKP